MSVLGRLLAPLGGGVEVLWPQRCPLCERWIDPGEEALCAGTGARERPLVHRRCLPRLEDAPFGTARPARIDAPIPVRWALADTPALFRLLHRLKYGGEPLLSEPLVARLASAAAARGWLPADAVIVPVPDEPRRRRERGYGVCERLADGLARRSGRSLRVDLLRRRGGGVPQAVLVGEEERRRNVAGRFAVGRLAEVDRRRPLVLLDDQVTTGATLAAALRLLGGRGHPLLALAVAGAKGAPTELGLDTRGTRAQTPTGVRPTSGLAPRT